MLSLSCGGFTEKSRNHIENHSRNFFASSTCIFSFSNNVRKNKLAQNMFGNLSRILLKNIVLGKYLSLIRKDETIPRREEIFVLDIEDRLSLIVS